MNEQRVIEAIEAEQVELAKNRQDFYGVRRMPSKAKGSVGRFASNRGLTKGVKTGRMVTFYQEGRGPKADMLKVAEVGDFALFIFKGEMAVGSVEKFNEHTFTVSIEGLDRKVPIRYDKFVGISRGPVVPNEVL